MLNILVLTPTSQDNLYFSSLIEGSYYCDLQTSTSVDEAIELMIQKDYELAVVSIQTKNIEKLTNLIKNIPNDKMATIICSDHKHIDHAKSLVASFKSKVAHYDKTDGPKKLIQDISQVLQLTEKTIPDDDQLYCKIHIDYFKYQERLIGDLYIKLSGKKYLKVFNKNDTFSGKDIEKYCAKNCNHFYVKASDLDFYTKSLLTNVQNSIEQSGQVTLLYPVHLQEAVKETIQKIGINSTAIRATDLAIGMTLNIIKSNLTLAKLWGNIVENSDYISEHSFMLSYISCSICNGTTWRGSANNVKLCLAAIFHDITLSSEHFAKISSLENDDAMKLSTSEKMQIKNHPIEAVSIIEKLDGVPSDVDKIIISHHEKYDGSGFPKGIDHRKITPLPAIFIQAHLILDELYTNGFSKEVLEQAIHEQKMKFEEGYFHENLEALSHLLR